MRTLNKVEVKSNLPSKNTWEEVYSSQIYKNYPQEPGHINREKTVKDLYKKESINKEEKGSISQLIDEVGIDIREGNLLGNNNISQYKSKPNTDIMKSNSFQKVAAAFYYHKRL